MRHWFLVLMIALLPLRGWVGDAMAMDMLTSPAHNMQPMSAMAADTGHPCSDHALEAANDAGMQADTGDHAHTACDVCNGPAMALVSVGVQPLHPAHSVRSEPVERFASSEARRGVKPPIS